jgi:hypothetical protein
MNRFLRQIFFFYRFRNFVRFFKNDSVPLNSTNYGYAPRPRRMGDPRDAIDIREKNTCMDVA